MSYILYKLNDKKFIKSREGKIYGHEKQLYQKNLADNTWSQIQAGLRAGNPMGWAVGDTKTLTLTNGDTYTIRLVDLQEGRYVSTDGTKCKATFEFVELLKGITRAMNSSQKTYEGVSNYSAGGWLNSDMRAYLKSDVISLIPDELSNVMLLNKVGSASYGGSGRSDTTAGGKIIYSDGDKLFLAAQGELFDSTHNYEYTTEATAYPQFDYYKAHNTNSDRVKHQLGSTSGTWYWNRSPSYGGANYFCNVYTIGSYSYDYANSTGSVCPCFTL